MSEYIPWDDLAEAYYQGFSATQAAKLLGLSRTALDYRLKKSGIGKR